MRIFLAARYGRREEVECHAKDLRAMGHEVVSTWHGQACEDLDASFRDIGMDKQTQQRAGKLALENALQISMSDILIAFTEQPAAAYVGGGRHVELGIMLGCRAMDPGRKQRIMTVGWRENIFCSMTMVEHFQLWVEALCAVGAAPLVVAWQ